ncbi:MAG: zinc-binding dehydrogenase [Bacteroidota bacterium]
MKALVVIEDNSIAIEDISKPQPGPGEVRVKLEAVSINKRDYWISKGKYPGIVPGTVLGSDGAGNIDQIGEGVSKTWLDRAVIINPNVNWGNDPLVQGKDYTILGMPTNGTFAEYVVVNVDRVINMPNHLNYHEAAALPLAALTAYRACFHHGKFGEGDKVLISGFGGGVAHFAFLFAKATGAMVSITSGHEKNLVTAKELGADQCFNYRSANWIEEAALKPGGYDLIIDSAGGDQFNGLIQLLNPGGKIVFYGASNGLPDKLDLYRLFWKQGTIQGSTMGNDEEFKAMVKYVEQYSITPLICHKYPFDQIVNAIEQMDNRNIAGKNIVML